MRYIYYTGYSWVNPWSTARFMPCQIELPSIQFASHDIGTSGKCIRCRGNRLHSGANGGHCQSRFSTRWLGIFRRAVSLLPERTQSNLSAFQRTPPEIGIIFEMWQVHQRTGEVVRSNTWSTVTRQLAFVRLGDIDISHGRASFPGQRAFTPPPYGPRITLPWACWKAVWVKQLGAPQLCLAPLSVIFWKSCIGTFFFLGVSLEHHFSKWLGCMFSWGVCLKEAIDPKDNLDFGAQHIFLLYPRSHCADCTVGPFNSPAIGPSSLQLPHWCPGNGGYDWIFPNTQTGIAANKEYVLMNEYHMCTVYFQKRDLDIFGLRFRYFKMNFQIERVAPSIWLFIFINDHHFYLTCC